MCRWLSRSWSWSAVGRCWWSWYCCCLCSAVVVCDSHCSVAIPLLVSDWDADGAPADRLWVCLNASLSTPSRALLPPAVSATAAVGADPPVETLLPPGATAGNGFSVPEDGMVSCQPECDWICSRQWCGSLRVPSPPSWSWVVWLAAVAFSRAQLLLPPHGRCERFCSCDCCCPFSCCQWLPHAS